MAATLGGVGLPPHVLRTRPDGRQEVLLHRSLAFISPGKVEIRRARSAIVLPLLGLALSVGAIWWMAYVGGLPLWALVLLLLFCLAVVPLSVMSLVGAIAGAEVVADAQKQSITWQQGYLGMGLGTRELVPFWKIDHLEVTIEGDQPDRWHDHADALRQFALVLIKEGGKRLTLVQVPVPAYGQEDGMDRTLTVGQAIATLAGKRVDLPAGWELTTIDTATGRPPPPASPAARRKRGRSHRGPA